MTGRPIGIATTALALAVATAGLMVPAQAGADGQWYIAPAINFVVADDDRNADDGPGIQVGIGRELGARWNLELNFEANNLDFENGGGAWKQRGAAVDGLFFFDREGTYHPYALLGIGALHNRVPGDKSTDPMANAGLGVLVGTAWAASLRAEARYRWDHDDKDLSTESSFGDWVFSLGLHIPLGRAVAAPAAIAAAPPPPAPAPAPVAVVADSDGDGVADGDDACPDTPDGARVDARGCEIDSDGDGVPDSRDRCPGTPTGATVDNDGCERDSDGDGVPDSRDRCPETSAGARVDVRGCEIKEVISLSGVNFETGSARLLPESTSVLDETAETLLKHPEIRAEVGGHSDSTGPRTLNLTLSRQRAEAVMEYLVSQGVAAERLSAAGYGPDRPVADNASPEGRAANRRVELKISE